MSVSPWPVRLCTSTLPCSLGRVGDHKLPAAVRKPVSGRVSRDARRDSDAPSSQEETRFGPASGEKVPAGIAVRISSLEAEVERLLAQQARDAGQLAEVLLVVAEEKRA